MVRTVSALLYSVRHRRHVEMPHMEEFITTGTLAREAAVAPETIRRKIDAGEITAIKTANGYRIIARAVADQFLRRRAELMLERRAAR